MDSVVHFEIPSKDLKRGQKFYESVFGWKFEDVPEMDYKMVMTTPGGKDKMPKEPGAINGGMMKRDPKIKSPVLTISVKDIDDSLGRIKKSGGKVVYPKESIGDMGFVAYFSDREGNVMGLWQSGKT
jgi:uncharacterized protein